jgi:hypothetical protein
MATPTSASVMPLPATSASTSMTREEVYRLLVDAVNSGKLQEPFTTMEFRKACPGLSVGTYRAFVWRHSRGTHNQRSA